MAQQDRIDRLRLARTRRVGPVTYLRLIERFGSAAAALSALPDLVRRSGGQPFAPASEREAWVEMQRVEVLRARHLLFGDADYPALLANAPAPPVALIVCGDTSLFARPTVAMVGARNASAAACRFARQIAADLGGAGHVVISGLARGIDTAAHLGALPHGTIAVIGSGIDRHFPAENAALQEDIAQHHLLVTEYVPGTEPLARNFPHRNRIIAGAALGTLVVEAAPKSGSLLTARMATEAGREVMAVPGSPLDPRARGCNDLIREGATLIQSAADIIEALAPLDPRMVRQAAMAFTSGPPREPVDEERERIVALLGPVPVAVDELVRQAALATAIVQTVLIDLELAGRLERHAGGRVSLAF